MAQHRCYTQITQEERDQIATLYAQRVSLSEIARQIHRNKSTISREISRNKAPIRRVYGACRAHNKAKERKIQAGQRPRLKNSIIRNYVKRHLRMEWTPEQIAGRLRIKYPRYSICVESIYRFIYDPDIRRQENFVHLLPRAHRIRNRRGQRKTHRMSHIPERKSILERPVTVQHRHQAGHWEADTVTARTSKAALLATVERKSRYTKLARLKRRTAKQVRITLNRSLSQYGKHLRRTITYDNGQENVEHVIVNKTLGTRSYFCQPFHSWEKGTVENTIGIIRRTYPKKTNFDLVSASDVKRLERKLNNTPRKILHYLTPKEVFKKIVALPH
ncbi:MAG: IS30 family transposase [Candidatus Doudnabacteria bacterium]|nr:IS30 family transposase [Candidatus Doudnabacteria bacterium]